MMYKLIAFLLIFLCYSIFAANAIGLVLPQDLPKPKYINTQTGSIIKIGANTKINITQNLNQKYNYPITELASILSNLSAQDNIVSSINIKILNPASLSHLSKYANMALQHKEGYYINISKTSISIDATDESGIINGITTLESIIQSNSDGLEQAEIVDWPDLNIRALHFALHQGTTVDDIKSLILEARKPHFNTIIIMLMDGVKFQSMSKISRKDALTPEELRNIIKFANENGIDIIPEIKLLTQQKKHLLKDAYPDIMLNDYTYDPNNTRTYSTIFPMLDEIIQIMQPKAIHIGHDEVIGVVYDTKKILKPNDKILSVNDYEKDVNIIHEYLLKNGVKTWMWGDMLIAPKEFPFMDKSILNGKDGYANLRNKLPKDIVICDWHYWDRGRDFPTAQAFSDSGHQVLGAVWGANQKNENITDMSINNFSRYVANMKNNNTGMIATTWFQIKDKKKLISKIIKISGEAFWNAK